MAVIKNKKTEDTQVNYNVEVLKVKEFEDGNINADLKVNGITVYGCRVVDGKKGAFISLPSRKGKDDKYYNIVYFPIDDKLTDFIIDEINKKL